MRISRSVIVGLAALFCWTPLTYAGDEANQASGPIRSALFTAPQIPGDDRPPPIATNDYPVPIQTPADTHRAGRQIPLAPSGNGSRLNAPAAPRPRMMENLPPWATAAASLGIVLGLFLAVAWVVRRGMPRQVPLLPREAIEVLGRTPLAGRHQVHLLRCGNKILLVSVTPSGVETLGEVTDPIEVDRLAGICEEANPRSTSVSFMQVFKQLDHEHAAEHRGRRPFDEPEFDHADYELGNRRELSA